MSTSLLKNQAVSLAKSETGIMQVTLSWTNVHADVDLACMIETDNNGASTKTVVQALDKNFGSLNMDPWVALDGDARSGGSETLQVNLAHADRIKRAIVFAYIYSGGNWGVVGDARVVVNHPTEGQFDFNFSDRSAHSCTLVELKSDGNGGLSLTRLEDYFRGFHDEIDRHYGWPNINWTPGTKD